MMVGVGFYSYIIGTVSQVLDKMDNRKSTLKAKIDVIEVFCSETNLKPNLKKKILNTLEYNSQRNAFSWIDKFQIFNEIPNNLKYQICM